MGKEKRRDKIMDFFEELKERARGRLGKPDKYKAQGFVAGQMYKCAIVGIDATIEALKEMVAGEPIAMNLDVWDGDTLLVDKNGEIHARWDGTYHGTDGEEVYVVVIRSGGPKDETHTYLPTLEATQE